MNDTDLPRLIYCAILIIQFNNAFSVIKNLDWAGEYRHVELERQMMLEDNLYRKLLKDYWGMGYIESGSDVNFNDLFQRSVANFATLILRGHQ